MRASHNTFTYMKSSWFMEIFSFLWRCQSKSAVEQVKKYDVSVCDIRVYHSKKGWRMCHGRASYGPTFDRLSYLIHYCVAHGFKHYRLIYERNNKAITAFKTDFDEVPDYLKDECICAIHKPTWTTIYGFNGMFVEHNKHMWYEDKSLWFNIKNFFSSTIKSYAKKHNTPSLTTHIDMFDYVEYIKIS